MDVSNLTAESLQKIISESRKQKKDSYEKKNQKNQKIADNLIGSLKSILLQSMLLRNDCTGLELVCSDKHNIIKKDVINLVVSRFKQDGFMCKIESRPSTTFYCEERNYDAWIGECRSVYHYADRVQFKICASGKMKKIFLGGKISYGVYISLEIDRSEEIKKEEEIKRKKEENNKKQTDEYYINKYIFK